MHFRKNNGLRILIGGFTNLTEDHLDFYHTMDNYLNAKLDILNYMKKTEFFL